MEGRRQSTWAWEGWGWGHQLGPQDSPVGGKGLGEHLGMSFQSLFSWENRLGEEKGSEQVTESKSGKPRGREWTLQSFLGIQLPFDVANLSLLSLPSHSLWSG